MIYTPFQRKIIDLNSIYDIFYYVVYIFYCTPTLFSISTVLIVYFKD